MHGLSNGLMHWQLIFLVQVQLRTEVPCTPISLTRETRHIVPPCNKARISKFHVEFHNIFETLLLYQFLLNYSEIFTREMGHIVLPCGVVGISKFCVEFLKFPTVQISLKC